MSRHTLSINQQLVLIRLAEDPGRWIGHERTKRYLFDHDGVALQEVTLRTVNVLRIRGWLKSDVNRRFTLTDAGRAAVSEGVD